MKRQSGENYALKILKALMRSDKPLSTNQLCDIVGCERKTVYYSMDILEVSGFAIEIINEKGGGSNFYRFVRTYGL